jgi:hypothetical protein
MKSGTNVGIEVICVGSQWIAWGEERLPKFAREFGGYLATELLST